MPPQASSLPRHRVLITGASSGIGKATAQAFAQAGFDVALVARSEQKLHALALELAALGIKAQAFPMDLANLATVKPNIMAIEATFGPINILVNSAGMGYTNSLRETSLADWQTVIALNVTSVFEVVKAVLPGMREQAAGLIINIASIAAQQSFENWGAYGVSKAALAALSDAIRVEEAAYGIRVVTLFPGAVNTAIWDTDTVQADFDRSAMLEAQTVAQAILQTALLPPNAVVSSLTLTPVGGAL